MFVGTSFLPAFYATSGGGGGGSSNNKFSLIVSVSSSGYKDVRVSVLFESGTYIAARPNQYRIIMSQ